MRFFTFLFLLMAFAPFAWAGVLSPSLKPVPHNTSQLLQDTEFTHFRKAIQAANDKRWNEARGYRAGVMHPAAAGLIDWKIALNDKDASYFELALAVQSLEDWPRHRKIRLLAEEKISGSGMQASAIADWFSLWPAISGSGKIAEAEALLALGKYDDAKAILIDAWRNNFLPKKVFYETLKKHGNLFTQEDHIARVNMLLWAQRATEAQKLLSRLPKDIKALSSARIRLMRRNRGVDKALAKVPTKLQTHPGLLYERAVWQRKAGRNKKALQLILAIPAKVGNAAGQKRLWKERHLLARKALKDNDYKTAYQLARANGFERGGSFAEGEWLAGWLALRKLNKPELAQTHFEKLAKNVRTPISMARAHYWLGKSLQAQNKEEAAAVEFDTASGFYFTFYGQLAQQEIGPGYITMGNDPEPDQWAVIVFENHPQVQALKLLALVGDTTAYRRFSYHLDDLLPGAVDHVMLARLNRENGYNGIAVRAAKAALYRNEILPESQWPLIEIGQHINQPEPALVLALSRQESELNPKAISHAGARGLMQLMPGTAKTTARQNGVKYRKSWLVDDPEYNLKIGAFHLQELLEEFDGSYILSAAAYNAGRSRAHKWIEEYGDPRLAVDPVDWLESIPFSETRNYVQRVLENIQIYRNRLSDRPSLIRLNEDINRGRTG